MSELKKLDTEDNSCRNREMCAICKSEDSMCKDMFNNPICVVCERKYGSEDNIFFKLGALGLLKKESEPKEDLLESQEIDIKGEIQLANKRSAIELINNIKYTWEISDEELRRFEW